MGKVSKFLSSYAKMHTALIGGLVSGLTIQYHNAWWLPFVTLGATALGVGAIGNTSQK